MPIILLVLSVLALGASLPNMNKYWLMTSILMLGSAWQLAVMTEVKESYRSELTLEVSDSVRLYRVHYMVTEKVFKSEVEIGRIYIKGFVL